MGNRRFGICLCAALLLWGGIEGTSAADALFPGASVRGQLYQTVTIGANPGRVQKDLPADQVVDLVINSTNSHGDTPFYEWFLLTATVGGHALPLYLLSDFGFFEASQVASNLTACTYSFDLSGITPVGTMSMSDLGLTAGDAFIYAYAYMNLSGSIIVDNIVAITVQ